MSIEIHPIGHVRSPFSERKNALRQGSLLFFLWKMVTNLSVWNDREGFTLPP